MVNNPFPLFPDSHITLAPAYLGGIGRFAAVAAAGTATIADDLPFNKRKKSVHRCDIADTRGVVRLTVPIVKPESSHAARWSDIMISDHNRWWQIHWVTLESAYGRTPFFEFYADRFEPFYRQCPQGRVVDFTRALDNTVLDILGLPPLAEGATACSRPTELSQIIDPSALATPYWQVRADRFGFIPGLSILDLIFNLGPEAPLYLYRLAAKPMKSSE